MQSRKPYEAGFRDFFRGELDCKYRPKSFYAKEWQRGFDTAYTINKETYVQSL